MKKFLIIALSFVLIFSMVSCGSSDKTDDKTSSNTNSEYEKVAKDQNISTSELEKIVDELAQITADKYGISKEDYINQTKDAGKTVLQEMKTAADTMGISIKEYYDYEKNNEGNHTKEQKETMSDMAKAKEEAESLLDGSGNKNARIVKGDPAKLCKYEVKEITEEEKIAEDHSVVFITNKSPDTMMKYYENLLEDTNMYTIVNYPSIGGVVSGTIDGKLINIVVDGEEEPTTVSFSY